MPRTDIPPTWDERATLATLLDYARATVRVKTDGLSPADARRAPIPGNDLMTVAGLVSHVSWVEYLLLEVIFLGADDEGPWTEEDPDAEWSPQEPLPDLLDAYDARCAHYRELVASRDLDEFSVREKRHDDGTSGRVTLRWIVTHLIEEIGRHNGHLDIVRELIDGVRGD